MAPYEGVAVIESERIEQNAEELEKRFRCARAGQLLNEPGLQVLRHSVRTVMLHACPGQGDGHA